MPWRGPRYEGEFPSLGWGVLRWWTESLVVPDGPYAGQPYLPTREQAEFLLRFFAVDPVTGKRRVRRAVLSRSKGWGKSPFVAGIALAEALADVVPDGWDADGEPVGRTWVSLGAKAKVQIVATSEDQTVNTWEPLTDMAAHVAVRYDLDVMATFVAGHRLRIEPTSSSATSREGFRPVFAALDQTESFVSSNGGHKLAATIRRNLSKTGGASIETPNSFRPGEDSVSERSFRAWRLQQEGKTRGRAGGILFDHREAPGDTDLADRESLRAGLAYAYGCSAIGGCAIHGPECADGWADLDRLVEEVWDPDTSPADARTYYLNQVTSAEDAWLAGFEIEAAVDTGLVLADRDVVVLGFDGSRGRARGGADATVLVAVRVTDGAAFELYSWEPPAGPAGAGMEVPEHEVEAAVHTAMRRYKVVGFFGDPAAGWSDAMARWTAKYGRRMRVRRTKEDPIRWKTNQHRLWADTLLSLNQAIRGGRCRIDGSSVLVRHLGNARRKSTPSGITIVKATPDSPRKIDGVVALTYAWAAYLEAVAKGLDRAQSSPGRIR